MKIYQIILLFVCSLVFFCSAAFGADVDGVAGASKKNYYQQSSLTGDELLKVIKNRDAAFVLSTTNPDNSPNAGVFIPGVVSDSVLKFGMAKNQTALNIKRTRKAVLTVYRLLPDQSGKHRHQGARLILELLEGEKAQQSARIIQMKIKRVLPLG